MIEEQQIEKAAKALRDAYESTPWNARSWFSLAEEVCKAIIPQDAVVLSREKYDTLLLEQKRLKEIVDRIPCGYELKEQTRKQTAKEIWLVGKYYYSKHASKDVAMNMFTDWIKDEYEIEVD